MFGKLLLIIGLVATGLLLALFTFTTPADAGAIGILGAFLLAYVIVLTLTTFVLAAVSSLFVKITPVQRRGLSFKKLSLRKSYYYASVIALAPVIVISMQSVGGAGIYEVGLICLFVVLGCVYIARRTG